MVYTDAQLNTAIDAVKATGTWVSAHTGDPGTTGASEVTGGAYGRVQTTWGSSAAGATTGTEVALNIPAGTDVTHWGVWSASSGGTFREGFALADPESFGGPGVLNVTPTLDANNI